MAHDDKENPHDDETPPVIEAEAEDNGEDAEAAIKAAGDKPQAPEESFPFSKSSKSLESEWGEPDFGMPDFGFLTESRRNGSPSAASASTATASAMEAVRNTLENASEEDTGWSNTASIEKSSAAKEELAGSDRRPPLHSHQANVMPFPGSPMPRALETPSETRGVVEEESTIFGSRVTETAELATELEPEAHDALADAVQSALRNVYGGRAAAVARETAPDFENYTVAESLKQAAVAERGQAEQAWEAAPAEWREEFQAEAELPEAESNTETVLDYLYSQRRGVNREGTVLSADASLRDFGEASGYGRDWQSGAEYDERDTAPDEAAEFGEQAYRGSAQFFPDPSDRTFMRDRSGYRGEASVEEPEWRERDFLDHGGNGGDGGYPVHIPGSAQDSLASSSPDSSHLLGAAGLGLIGGIALAGVLAVFVFNSMVPDGGESSSSDVTPKVVERLGASTAEPPQRETLPDAQPARPSRSVAVAPERQPPVEAPRSVPAPQPPKPLAAADVFGPAGGPIPLDIRLGDVPGRDEALVSIKGLPAQAKLSTGIDVGGGQWLLPPSRLRDLTVTVPEGASGSYSLEVQLLKDDAQTSLTDPVAFQLGIGDKGRRSASARGDATSATNEQVARLNVLPDETPQIETDMLTQMLIRDGNKLMRDGDIAGARRLYEQAGPDKNPEAALAMGRSYDPSYFEKLPVKTGKPDPATAFDWYKKALDGGLVTARVKIDGLKQWLQR